MIDQNLRYIIDYVFEYVDSSSNDWFRIKQEIINNFPPKSRSLFSRRHKATRKHILNSFDREVITYWESKSGSKLWVDPDKLHPADWVWRPSGWKIREINEQRKQQAKAKKTS